MTTLIKNSTTTRRKLVIAFFAIASILAVLAFLWYRTYSSNLNAVDPASNQTEIITINTGSTPSDIAQLLESEGLIKSASSFQTYTRFSGKNSQLKAGTYELSASQSTQDIVDVLVGGKEAIKTVTIIPGLSVEEIKETFIKNGFSEQDVQAAFNTIKPGDYINGVSEESLEGYIHPDTYSLGLSATVEDYIVFALQQFNNNISDDILQGITSQELSVNGATILSSIVQLESPDSEIQKTIAQVFLKRLDEGISLGADPTFRYAARLLNLPETPDVDSPYNTRIYTGLPPTAIANFNLSALEAVANPDSTDYLFFVAGDDGNTYFSNTLQEHEANVAQYCIELCKL